MNNQNVIPNTSIAQLSLANNTNNNINNSSSSSTMVMTPNSTDSPSMVSSGVGGEVFACDSPPRSLLNTFGADDSPTVVSDATAVVVSPASAEKQPDATFIS